MRFKFLIIVSILIHVHFELFALIHNKVIVVTMPNSLGKAALLYRGLDFGEKYLFFSNPKGRDTSVTVSSDLADGTVLSNNASMMIDGKPTLIRQSLIVGNSDTLQLSFDANSRLTVLKQSGFLIEDVINVFFDYPDSYAFPNNLFLDAATGISVTKSIFEKNVASIDKFYQAGRYSIQEHEILNRIAEADYYFRVIRWAIKNGDLDRINDEIQNLEKDKNEIQKVRSASLIQLFSALVRYQRIIKNVDDRETRAMLKMILNLGWNKGITFGYVNYILADIKNDRNVLGQSYSDLRQYLDGEFPAQLEKLGKKMLPTFTALDKIMLVTPLGKQLSFKQILDKNSGHYFVIDLWASWCKPCREQAPFFEKAKNKFLDKGVVFLSVSTDEDLNTSLWKKALKDDKLIDASNHYKLVTPKSNLFFKNFSLPSIPRYIIINSKGVFIDPDVSVPSDPEFEYTLLQLLAEKED